jgi:hypothetical protein
MGFIPPDSAVYEDGVEYPRSFEINDIPLGANFTIRAWVDLPQDQNTNGTVFVNTSIRSRFAPELPFVHTSQGDYLGMSWQPTEEADEGFDWSSAVETTIAYVKAWAFVVISIMVAGVIIYKAVIDRDRRLSEQSLLPYQQIDADSNDWMEKFRAKDADTAESTGAPSDTGTTYSDVSRMQVTSSPSQQAPPVEPRLVEAASIILGKGIEQEPDVHLPPPTSVQPQESVPLPSQQQKPEAAQTTPASPPHGPPDDLEF